MEASRQQQQEVEAEQQKEQQKELQEPRSPQQTYVKIARAPPAEISSIPTPSAAASFKPPDATTKSARAADLAGVDDDPRLRALKTLRSGEELRVSVKARKLGRDCRLRGRLVLVSSKAVSDADVATLKPYHRVSLRNLAGIAVPAERDAMIRLQSETRRWHETAVLIKVDPTRSKIADLYIACGSTAERNVLVAGVRTAFEAAVRRQLPVIKWVADHPRAMAV